MDERKDTYFYLQSKLSPLIEQISRSLDVPLNYLTHWEVIQYFRSQGVKFDNYGLPDDLKDYIAGMLVVRNGNVKISVNQYRYKVRQNFSRMHEIIHLIDDVDLSVDCQSFSSILKGEGYSEEEQRKEVKADIGASILMLNDWSLMQAILNDYSSDKIQRSFGISKGALWYRLSDFLEFEVDMTRYHAQKLASLYQIGEKRHLMQIIANRYNFRLQYASVNTLNLIDTKKDPLPLTWRSEK
ncbi:ImmA/IrrE family metallo-endopeptidase [Aerococcaceae bacterium NML191219]|nr:ImmA/IrrE family metallo-endopeptidase [Aerococcaceae bacterium NML191219]